MQAEQKRFVEKRYNSREWHGHTMHGNRAIKGFNFEQGGIPGWKPQRIQHDDQAKPKSIRSFWHHGESSGELLEVDVFDCASIGAAHDQLLEALSNMESAAIERRSGKNTPGDVAFGLGDSMILFARANLVVLIRNAGPTVVGVGDIARQLDKVFLQRLESKRTDKK